MESKPSTMSLRPRRSCTMNKGYLFYSQPHPLDVFMPSLAKEEKPPTIVEKKPAIRKKAPVKRNSFVEPVAKKFKGIGDGGKKAQHHASDSFMPSLVKEEKPPTIVEKKPAIRKKAPVKRNSFEEPVAKKFKGTHDGGVNFGGKKAQHQETGKEVVPLKNVFYSAPKNSTGFVRPAYMVRDGTAQEPKSSQDVVFLGIFPQKQKYIHPGIHHFAEPIVQVQKPTAEEIAAFVDPASKEALCSSPNAFKDWEYDFEDPDLPQI